MNAARGPRRAGGALPMLWRHRAGPAGAFSGLLTSGRRRALGAARRRARTRRRGTLARLRRLIRGPRRALPPTCCCRGVLQCSESTRRARLAGSPSARLSALLWSWTSDATSTLALRPEWLLQALNTSSAKLCLLVSYAASFVRSSTCSAWRACGLRQAILRHDSQIHLCNLSGQQRALITAHSRLADSADQC